MNTALRTGLLLAALATPLAHPVRAQRVDASDLPLVEIPAAAPGGRQLAVLLSGDGNWAATVQEIGEALARHGIPVVGLRSRAYLTSGVRTPEGTARDVERIIRAYAARWGRDQVLLVGYSRGADFVPFVLNRLSLEVRAEVRAAVMIGPSRSASFQFHLADLVRDTPRPTDLPTLPELQRLTERNVLCVYGQDELDSLCPVAPPGRVTLVPHSGGHHLRDDAAVLQRVLQAADRAR